ncbi:MAG: serine hydrolase domain-containing protein [Chloroflexota bacterium]
MSTPINDLCAPKFVAVQQAFEENFREFGDVGDAVAVYHHGQPVVDLWGGYMDAEKTKPWERDTIVNVWSVTKAIAAVCALRLVDQGLLELDTPVAHYWPEFAQAGKETLPVRYLLNHQAGLPGFSNPVPPETTYDWARLIDLLAQQHPLWTPGTAHGYHAATFGWLVGELVRRVSHKRIGLFLQDEIAHPMDIDFLIGVPVAEDGRVATVIRHEPTKEELSDDAKNRDAEDDEPSPTKPQLDYHLPELGDFAIFNSRQWRAAEVPSANGTTNARALARLYGALAGDGTIDGQQLLSPALIQQASAVESEGTDMVFGFRSCIGLGFGLNRLPGFMGPNKEAFGHPGMGGSLGFADPIADIGFGFVTSSIHSPPIQDARSEKLIQALYASLQ